MENQEELKLKRIQIKTEAGSKWFKTGRDFVIWIQEQRGLYAFVSKVPNQHNEHGLVGQLNNNWQPLLNISQNELPPLEVDEENYSAKVDILVNEFQKKLEARQIFTADAPFAEFVKELSIDNPRDAAAALAYFLDFNFGNWDMLLEKGVQRAADWQRDFQQRKLHEETSLQSFKQSWDEEFNRQGANADDAQERLDHLIKRAEQLITAQQNRFDKKSGEYEDRFNQVLSDAKTELENITKAYDEKMALQASVRYWGLQEKFHRQFMMIFGMATVVVACVTLFGLYQYADSFLTETIKTIQVGKLVTAAVLTTFGVWAVRTCANLFMSHTHLRTDAQERRTMMHTYLALLRKGQGPAEDERQLILQTLFRPSTTGMIKEDAGPSHLVDMLNRLSPGKGQ